ncbi:Nse4-domain-containing protein [Pseudovirgaria hyperparasitica]|uniref:Non-structural maintenance of chromosomes element 4 n=1 Tax=Pseudovirgaria hyperparasitica TaxID=470096 RepID=A0A6A6WMS1_9PEZI|nr:Nse4-domain-containing protein [Pseudovirgaria hyperparasitica]KAF2763514.1 Nse4-domain-containing protein [Pseudovirgaria hyperparasitica]
MARLNTAVPSSSRASSLYPTTPVPEDTDSERRVFSPPTGSDKENQSFADPDEDETRSRGKRKAVAGSSRRPRDMPQESRPSLTERNDTPIASRVPEELLFYDPDQNARKRQKLRKEMRENERALKHQKETLIQPGGEVELLRRLEHADYLMNKVRQTADATIDSQFLVDAGDIALKKATAIVNGDKATTIDTDEFVSKCKIFMRNAGFESDNEASASTQRRRQRPREHDDVDEDDDREREDLNWAHLGHFACFPANSRPPLPGFLLGPLSVQKRIRQVTQRQPRQQRRNVTEVRPEQLQASDLEKAETANVTAMCQQISKILNKHIDEKSDQLEEVWGDATSEEQDELLRKHRLALTEESETTEGGQPAMSLFDCVINPKSFGQTVENLFYVSFLIKESDVQIEYDTDGLPVLIPRKEKLSEEERAKGQRSKRQAIISIDYATWKQLITALDIKKPLIPHREE